MFQATKFMEVIDQDYHFRLYIDGLPSAVLRVDPVTGHRHEDFYEGIPVGKVITQQGK